ncbi:MAG: VOC family protein [Alphaproteobacteria bacterium]|nr:VOC family protein [Alphaproteobacteria bacterium]
MTDVRPALTSVLCYRDPRAAIAWLERAFGFELHMLIEGPEGRLLHVEMRLGESLLMVGQEWTENHRSPASLGGKNTQSVHIQLTSDLDAHCARARAAGAEILVEPATQPYGDRTYHCRDLEGHVWTVGQTVQEMTRADHEASGVKVLAWP